MVLTSVARLDLHACDSVTDDQAHCIATNKRVEEVEFPTMNTGGIYVGNEYGGLSARNAGKPASFV